LGVLPNAMSQSLMPGFVHARASSRSDSLETLYGGSVAGVTLCTLPLALLICVAARPFLAVWAGRDFARDSVGPVYLLGAGWLMAAASQGARNLLGAMGRLDVVARYQALEILPYFLATVLLVRRFGAAGAASAWTLRAAAESLLLFRAVRGLTGLRAPLPG